MQNVTQKSPGETIDASIVHDTSLTWVEGITGSSQRIGASIRISLKKSEQRIKPPRSRGNSTRSAQKDLPQGGEKGALHSRVKKVLNGKKT